MAEEEESALTRRNPRWEKLFEEAKDDPGLTRMLKVMARVMEENHELLERLAKS